jgi:hypothetical protein
MFDDIADCITQLIRKYPTFFNANAHHMRLNHTKKQLVNVFFIFRPLPIRLFRYTHLLCRSTIGQVIIYCETGKTSPENKGICHLGNINI